MQDLIQYEIAMSLKDTIFYNGYTTEIKKVKLCGRDTWRVYAKDVVTVDVLSPSNIVVYTDGESKSFNSEYCAKTFILSEIMDKKSKKPYYWHGC